MEMLGWEQPECRALELCGARCSHLTVSRAAHSHSLKNCWTAWYLNVHPLCLAAPRVGWYPTMVAGCSWHCLQLGRNVAAVEHPDGALHQPCWRLVLWGGCTALLCGIVPPPHSQHLCQSVLPLPSALSPRAAGVPGWLSRSPGSRAAPRQVLHLLANG